MSSLKKHAVLSLSWLLGYRAPKRTYISLIIKIFYSSTRVPHPDGGVMSECDIPKLQRLHTLTHSVGEAIVLWIKGMYCLGAIGVLNDLEGRQVSA